jgi:LEA14-like dessication related protein
MKKILFPISIFLFVMMIISSCSMLNTLTNLQKLKFKLNSVSDFKVSGIPLSGKSSITDFNFADALKVKNLLTGTSFPVQFILNVEAYNPNDGTSSPMKAEATISSMQWRLFLDDVQTISGNVSTPLTVPANGQSIIIPLTMDLDLYKFFSKRGLNQLLELAFAIGGVQSNLSHIKLEVQPTVKTNFGPITYPNWITVIDKDYSK